MSKNVCSLAKISTEANSVKPDQTDLDLYCLSKRLQIFQQTTKTYDIFVICVLRVNKCEFSVYTARIFMKCTHVWAAQTTY